MNPAQIVIAGASGFVGRGLIDKLLREFPNARIIALSRGPRESGDQRVLWKACDLFSEESIAGALPNQLDLVYYLVHSMEPTAQLDQGNFADYDLIMADNFARVCKTRGVRQLVYLGGLIPDVPKLSLHLQSRLEVEKVFEEYQIPHTFLRAGLIIGQGGSSFEILLKLVRRLRVMICPAWTQTLTSPVDLEVVLASMILVVKGDRHLGQTYDLAGCAPLTYLEMMRQTAKWLGLKRFFVRVPLFSPTLSRLWVSLISGASKGLIYPLIESLKHPMVARDGYCLNVDFRSRTYLDLMRGVSVQRELKSSRVRLPVPRQRVRSVQRMNGGGLSAPEIAERYFRWLRSWTLGLVVVAIDEEVIRLRLFGFWTLIELRTVPELMTKGRVTYAIQSGLLVRRFEGARLEFRLVLNQKFVLIAIHDYVPKLPWFIYRYTQALAHLWVMFAFRRHLSSERAKHNRF